MIVGITGPYGSGKTTAAKIFGRHWYTRIDADEIGHNILDNNKPIIKKIINQFGNEILDKNNKIDRKKLGDIVFNDAKKLRKLNSIMHPVIINEIRKKIKEVQEDCHRKFLVVIDAPLLLETEIKNFVDKIVVIKCDKRKIFGRLSQKFSKDKIERILKAQMPLREKLKYADFVIDNNKDLKHLEGQVKAILKKYCEKNFKAKL